MPVETENSQAPKRRPWTRQNLSRWFVPPQADDILLRTDEVAAWLGNSPHTIHWWRKIGRGPSHTIIEGKPRYWSGEIRRYIAAQQVVAA